MPSMPQMVDMGGLQVLNDYKGDNGPADHPVALGDRAGSERHRGTGNALLKKGDAGAAERCYDMALATAADIDQYAVAHCNRAAARLVMHKFVGAKADADRAAKLQPDNPKAFYRRAEAERNLEEWDAALSSYEEALILSPGDKLVEQGMRRLQEDRAAAEARRRAEEERRRLEEDQQRAAAAAKQAAEEAVRHADPLAEPDVLDLDDGDVLEQEELEGQGAPQLTAGEAEALMRDPEHARQARLRGEVARLRQQLEESQARLRRAQLGEDEEEEEEEEEDEEEVIDLHSDESVCAEPRPASPEVMDLDDDEPVAPTIAKRKDAAPAPGPSGGGAAKQKYSSDYSRFKELEGELSDEEDADAKAMRLTLEAADREMAEKAIEIFAFYDLDRDGHWNWTEACAATLALEGKELDSRAYNERCAEWGADPRDGWSQKNVECMYLSNGRATEYIGLRKHYAIVTAERQRREGVVLGKWQPGDLVEGKVSQKWRVGEIHNCNDDGTYDIVWCDTDPQQAGQGTTGVPPSHIRDRFVAYQGPSGLRGDGKRFDPSDVVNPRTGQIRGKGRAVAAKKDPRLKYRVDTFDRFNEIGCDLEDEAEVNKPKLPEDPVERLGISAAAAGMEDEDTGMVDRSKCRKLLGLRQ
eukprot:TRINITY_DN2955_c1_g1_i2.p1 TRINITY_DN2955_c1_g1~~TRINITY_DN2955_c1_g1_i2.p1  ORF type:complete len:641 (+),score=267.01 TRINITY_DN2955_c1_g1_i2:71-1993(+)